MKVTVKKQIQWSASVTSGRLSPTGLVVTHGIEQGCEFSVSLFNCVISAPSSDAFHGAPCSRFSLSASGITNIVHLLPPGLVCQLQEILAFPPSSAPLCFVNRVAALEGFPHKWASDTNWLVSNSIPSGTRWLWCKNLLFNRYVELRSLVLLQFPSNKPTGSHFSSCGACSAVNIGIPECLFPWGQHSKPLLLFSPDAF